MSSLAMRRPLLPLSAGVAKLVRTTVTFELLRELWLQLSRQSNDDFALLWRRWGQAVGASSHDPFAERVIMALFMWNVVVDSGQDALSLALERLTERVRTEPGFRDHLKGSVKLEGWSSERLDRVLSALRLPARFSLQDNGTPAAPTPTHAAKTPTPAVTTPATKTPTPAFGASPTPAFGASPTPAATTPAFGASPTPAATTPAFGASPTPAATTPVFGASPTPAATTPVFGASPTPAATTPVFGASPGQSPVAEELGTPAFGVSPTTTLGTSPEQSEVTHEVGGEAHVDFCSARDEVKQFVESLLQLAPELAVFSSHTSWLRYVEAHCQEVLKLLELRPRNTPECRRVVEEAHKSVGELTRLMEQAYINMLRYEAQNTINSFANPAEFEQFMLSLALPMLPATVTEAQKLAKLRVVIS